MKTRAPASVVVLHVQYLNIKQGKDHVPTLCRAVLYILSSPDTTRGGPEPRGICGLLGSLMGSWEMRIQIPLGRRENSIPVLCLQSGTWKKTMLFSYCLMYAVFHAYLKHMARITDNLIDCVHCCVSSCLSWILFNSRACPMNLVFALAEVQRNIKLYAIVKASLRWSRHFSLIA